MKKLILAFIISLFFTAITLGFAEDTSKILEPPSMITPVPERKPTLRVPELPEISIIQAQPETPPQLTIPQLPQIPTVQPQAEPPLQYQPLALREMPAIRGVKESDFQWAMFNDFTGGLNLKAHYTQLKPNEALDLENAYWDKMGAMRKRDGYSRYNSSTFPNYATQSIRGLYRYYKQNDSLYLLVGCHDSLYRGNDAAGTFTAIAKMATDKEWYFETFDDKAIIVQEGSDPVVWDGDSIITDIESKDSFWVEWSDIEMDTVYTDCYQFRASFELTSPPAAFDANELAGQTFEWRKHAGSSEIQRMLVLSNTTDKIYTTLPCSLDLVPDKAERWCWFKPWHQSTTIDSGTTDSVTVCMDCETWADHAPSVRFWDTDIDTTKIKRDWTYVFEATDSRGNIWANYIEDFGVTGGVPWIVMNGWMVACFDEATNYDIYRLSSWFGGGGGVKFVEAFDGRLWFAWTGSGVDQNKNRIIWSEVEDMSSFPIQNNIWLESNDGDYITGMVKFFSDQTGFKSTPLHELAITKNNSFYKIVPSSSGYDLYYVAKGIGCVAPRSLVSVEGKLIIFLHWKGVYAYDGNKVHLLSDKIEPLIKGINQANIYKSAGVYYDRHYWLSYPDSSDTTNNKTIVLNVETGAWTKADIKASCWATQDGVGDTIRLVFGNPDSSWVYRYGTQDDDISDPVVLTYQSAMPSFGESWMRKRFRLAGFEYYADQGSVFVYGYIDKKDSLVFTDTIAVSGYAFEKLYLNSDNAFCRALSIKIKTSDTVNKFTLSQYLIKLRKDSEW